MGITFEIPITYTMIYGRKGDFPANYLSGLNRNMLIKCALLLLHNQENWNNTRTFCEKFFSRANEELANEFWMRTKELSNPKNDTDIYFPPKYSILSKHCCLELLRICFSLTPDNQKDNLDKKETERRIFDALLSINEAQSGLCLDKIEGLSEPLKGAYSILMTTLPYNEFTNVASSYKFISSCIKSKIFFEFCEKNDNYRVLLKQFLENHHCLNWEMYIFTIAKIFIMSNGDDDNFTTISLDPNDESYDQDLSILSGLSIDIKEVIPFENNADYKVFRNFPLIQIDTNEFMVIYSSLCAERIYNSLIFNFNCINKDLPKKERISDLFQNFTTNFSERYMFYEVMKTIISKQKYLSKSGDECREISDVSEPDYYIRNWNDIFLFEYKDVLMDANTKISGDYNKLKELIERKLVYNKENKSNKGIEQLIENIIRMLSATFVWDKNIISNKVKIYPILVVGDAKFVSPGMCCILNDYFCKSLEAKGICRKQIKNLIIIDINTLILYQNEFADKNMTIREICENYYKYLRTVSPHPNKLNNIAKNAFHHLFSISTFIEENYKIKTKRLILSDLIEKFQSKGLK